MGIGTDAQDALASRRELFYIREGQIYMDGNCSAYAPSRQSEPCFARLRIGKVWDRDLDRSRDKLLPLFRKA